MHREYAALGSCGEHTAVIHPGVPGDADAGPAPRTPAPRLAPRRARTSDSAVWETIMQVYMQTVHRIRFVAVGVRTGAESQVPSASPRASPLGKKVAVVYGLALSP